MFMQFFFGRHREHPDSREVDIHLDMAECAGEIPKGFVSLSEAVKYAVALNKRNFMWDVLTPEVDKWVPKEK